MKNLLVALICVVLLSFGTNVFAQEQIQANMPITWSWAAAEGVVDTYSLEKSLDDGTTWNEIAVTTTTQAIDTAGIAGGATAIYRAVAENISGKGPYSDNTDPLIGVGKPGKPGALIRIIQ